MNNHRELLSYFNLTELPFTKEIPVAQLHLLPSVEHNLAAAQLLVDTRGIGAITGKPGTGKSCLLRLLQRLPAGLYRTFYLCHSSVGTVEFYAHLSVLFGLQPNYHGYCSEKSQKDAQGLRTFLLPLSSIVFREIATSLRCVPLTNSVPRRNWEGQTTNLSSAILSIVRSMNSTSGETSS